MSLLGLMVSLLSECSICSVKKLGRLAVRKKPARAGFLLELKHIRVDVLHRAHLELNRIASA